MEAHQVTWNTNLPYEDLVKQCPFFSQRSSLSLEKRIGDDLEIPVVHISKSKKKRLKRRLKAISLNNKNQISEETHPVLLENSSEMSSKANNSSAADTRKKQETEKSKRVNDEVDGEITISHPRFSGGKILAEAENQKKNKQQKKESNLLVKQEKLVISSELNNTSHKEANRNSDVLLSQEKCPISKKDIIIDSLKDINSIIAQTKISEKSREEKRLAKHKKIDKSRETSDEKPASATQISGNLVVDSQQKLSQPSNNQLTEVNLPQDPIKIDNIDDKSRQDVLAEREAKKKAKQLAKQKKVGSTQEVILQKQSSETDKIKTEIVTPAVDSVSSQKKINVVRNDSKIEENKAEIEKSKSQLRAERRAKQEAQRAAKEAEKKQKDVSVENKENQVVKVAKKLAISKNISKEPKTLSKGKVVSQQQIKLFSHLHLRQRPSQIQLIQNTHPSVIELGTKYSSRIINGSNARCIALLKCLKEVIYDYSTPAEKEFSRGLESKLGELTNYLNQSRPFAVSMTNALRHIKSHLTQLPNNVSDDEAKRKLFDVIDTFIREQIDVAGEAICESVKNKITNGDVILIYSCSSLLYRILTETHRSGREFSVIVVDGGPWYEGREMLRRLVDAGLKCTYVQISALSFILRQATKVLFGAHALLANGCVMSRAGSALVALCAHAYSVPVLVCCETYKFCERVQTDAFVYNELGCPEDLVKEDAKLKDWQSLMFLTPLSIVYDITPPDLVTSVITEVAVLPCTSVPVILRIKPSDLVS